MRNHEVSSGVEKTPPKMTDKEKKMVYEYLLAILLFVTAGTAISINFEKMNTFLEQTVETSVDISK